MARGWESKSVEAQMEAASEASTNGKGNLTPQQLEAQHQKQSLTLSRNRVLQQIEASTNPRYTEMLQKALAELDAKLKELP